MERLRNMSLVFSLLFKKWIQPLKSVSFLFFLVLTALFIWLAYYTAGLTGKMTTTDRWLHTLHEERNNIQTIQSTLYALEAGTQGFIISGNTAHLSQTACQTAALYTALDNIKHLFQYDPAQQQLADSLKQLVTQRLDAHNRSIQQRFRATSGNTLKVTAAGLATDTVNQILAGMLQQTGNGITTAVATQTAYTEKLRAPFIAGGVITLFLLLASWFHRQQNRGLQEKSVKRESRFRSFIEEAQVMMFIADLNGNFTYVNKKLAETSGYAREELVGRHYSIFLDAETTERLRVAYSEQYAYNTPQTTHEFLCTTKTGEKRWVEQHLTLYQENGMIRGFQAIVKDIHEQKQMKLEMDRLAIRQNETQYRLQAILDHSTSIIFIKDLEGRYLLANKPFEAINNLGDGEAVGKTDQDFANGSFVTTSAHNDRSVIKHKQPVKVVETITVHGTERHIFMTRFPLFDSEQQMFGICGIGIDITERIMYERELVAAKKIAEDAKQAQEIFLANMSHEIRTPINGIMGMAYLLNKTLINPPQREYLDGIKDASQNLLVIINDILDFSKMRAGKMALEKVRINIRSLINKVVIRLQPQADKKGVSLCYETDENIPANLSGDAVRISQILGNLIENAIKFTIKGSINVSARLLAADETTSSIGFEVKDTGIGIPEDKLEMIFESFTQTSAENTRKYGGTGLGLAICKELVTLQGGRIAVNSIQHKGSTFYVEIPFPHHAGNAQETDTATEKMPDNVLQGKYLLLAEDNILNQKVAYYILQQAGAMVDIADNGKAALQRVLEKQYDCVLMDIQMPEIDGYQTTALIRQTGNAIPIIAMTASAIAGEEEKCIGAGMNDYISKPFVPETLLLKILQCIGERITRYL